MSRTILDTINILRPINAQASSTSATYNGAIIDMEGYDGVLFIVLLNSVAAGGSASLSIQEAAVNSQGSMVAAGTPVVATGTTASNGLTVLETFEPAQRFVQPTLTISGGAVVVDGVIAVQYRGKVNPTTLSAQVIASLQQENV